MHELSSLSSCREKPSREMENEQILADFRAEIQEHDFQADSDRRSTQELSGIIESQRREVDHTFAGDEQLQRDQQLLGPAGPSLLVRCDRGTHNRGVFSSIRAKNGVVIRPAGLEAPETNWKSRTTRCHAREDDVESHQGHARFRERMNTILSECLNAASEMARHGCSAPAQWVLSSLPPNPATMGDEDECLDVGALQAHADGPTTFVVQSCYRAKAREAFVRWGAREKLCRDSEIEQIRILLERQKEQILADYRAEIQKH